MGDFNVPMSPVERSRGGSASGRPSQELKSVLDDCQLFDLTSSGCQFTWCNNQRRDERIYCKLDRVVVNEEWIDCYKEGRAVF
jgi:hypothetical protein